MERMEKIRKMIMEENEDMKFTLLLNRNMSFTLTMRGLQESPHPNITRTLFLFHS